ncbi:MAG: hypothetical protein QOJ03_1564 [Frankiaceae bacterium]|nr:hypothetical protein [Frankiaceae bacterium]
MFIDRSGSLGMEHARDLHRSAVAFRAGRVGRHDHSALREFAARTHLGPALNYRSR